MAQRGRPKKKTKIEYINTTNFTIWLDKYNIKGDGLEGLAIEPGKSAFLTPEEEEMNKTNSPSYFLQGQLRIADAGDGALVEIKVRNDMSQLEIVKYVERIEDIEVFREEIQTLTSINTIELVIEEVKKSNKTLDFYFALQDLKDEVDTSKKKAAGFYND